VAKSRIPWKALAAGGVVLGVFGIGKAISVSKRRQAEAQVNQRIAIIGDSYAAGLDNFLKERFPNFKFEGHVGTNTSQWAAHSSACGSCGDWLPAFKPDVVLVSLGVNDGKTPNSTNYQTIVRALHGLGARVVWIEPPAAVSAPAVRDAIASLGVQTVPATTVPLSKDGLHPDRLGYMLWADEIADAVAPMWRRVPRA